MNVSIGGLEAMCSATFASLVGPDDAMRHIEPDLALQLGHSTTMIQRDNPRSVRWIPPPTHGLKLVAGTVRIAGDDECSPHHAGRGVNIGSSSSSYSFS
jgi:hypothetical protein